MQPVGRLQVCGPCVLILPSPMVRLVRESDAHRPPDAPAWNHGATAHRRRLPRSDGWEAAHAVDRGLPEAAGPSAHRSSRRPGPGPRPQPQEDERQLPPRRPASGPGPVAVRHVHQLIRPHQVCTAATRLQFSFLSSSSSVSFLTRLLLGWGPSSWIWTLVGLPPSPERPVFASSSTIDTCHVYTHHVTLLV